MYIMLFSLHRTVFALIMPKNNDCTFTMLPLVLTVFLTCMVLTAMITDITRFIIPNLLVVMILLTYPSLLFIAPVMPDWQISLLIALGTFFIGFGMFALKLMGGGDVKLLAVLALYLGKESFFDFLFWTAIFGGILSVVLVTVRPIVTYLVTKAGKPPNFVPRILIVGEPAPYGVAIGMSFLILLWSGRVTGISF